MSQAHMHTHTHTHTHAHHTPPCITTPRQQWCLFFRSTTDSRHPPCSPRFAHAPLVRWAAPTSLASLTSQGPGCSSVSTVVTVMAAVFNLVTVSPSAGDAVLSNKDAYPFFLRTTGSHTVWVPAAVELCKHFRWSRVAALAQKSSVELSTMSAFLELAAKGGIDVAVNEKLSTNSYSADIRKSLDAIVYADARIIVMYGRPAFTRQFFCDASRRGLVGEKYVYMLPGSWIFGNWWKRVPGVDVHTCTDSELKQATQGYLQTAPSTTTMSPATLPGATGETAADWRLRYKAKSLGMGVEPSDFGANAYDAIVRFRVLHHPH